MILDRTGQPVASISISTPADRMPPARQRTYGRLVAEAARAITATLRGAGHLG